MRILIRIGDLRISTKLNDSVMAKKIWEHLPVTAKVNTWGKEIYFKLPLPSDQETGAADQVVEKGDVAFWPEENCFCIFFGPTPISTDGEIRPASPVDVVGFLEGDYNRLNHVQEQSEICLERVEG